MKMTKHHSSQTHRASIPDFPLDPNDRRPVHVELVYEPRPNPWVTPAAQANAKPDSGAPESLPGPTDAISRALGALTETADAPLARVQQSERAPNASAKSVQSRPRRVKSSPSSRATHPTPLSPHPSSLSHHQRHCSICRHPERDAIEEEFIHWHPPAHIAYDYKVSSRALFRHAHAAGLFSLRDRKLRFALGHIVERAQDVTPTADSIIRAVHAYSRVNDEGQWIDPPAHIIVSSGTAVRNERPVPASFRTPVESLASGIELPALPVTQSRVEHDPTR